MKRIADIIKMMDEEIESAKCYAEKYIEKKADEDSIWSGRFYEMANNELQHSEMLHELAIHEIDKINKIFKPRADMQKKWDEEHKNYMYSVTWVKEMLSM